MRSDRSVTGSVRSRWGLAFCPAARRSARLLTLMRPASCLFLGTAAIVARGIGSLPRRVGKVGDRVRALASGLAEAMQSVASLEHKP